MSGDKKMILREDILSMEYLKKTEFTGSHQGMRYRLEGIRQGEEKALQTTVWPEPFNYWKTPEDQKEREVFPFTEEGVVAAVEWMNERLREEPEKWKRSWDRWTDYSMG